MIGAGLAGLACALDLARAGRRVTLHEAAAAPGGRCRSFHDERLGRRIDNGNHLILSANRAVLSHAEGIGAADRLEALAPEFPFVDLADGRRWTVRVPATPLGMARRDARPPGVGVLRAGADMAALLVAGRRRTVADAIAGRGPMWRAFWEPMTTAVLNLPPEEGSAALMRAALTRSFLRGAAACRPIVAPDGLGAALIEPAVARLTAMGAEVRLRAPLRSVGVERGRAVALDLASGAVVLGPSDAVVLAISPPAVALALDGAPGTCPVLPAPGLAILNAHFVVPPGVAEAAPPILGLLGGEAEWVFRRGDVLSVTISAAERSRAWAMGREAALDLIWGEVAAALSLGTLQPLARRLLRERAATILQTPEEADRRPGPRLLPNLMLAGDWTATGLPATLEGAVLSGRTAARALLEEGR